MAHQQLTEADYKFLGPNHTAARDMAIRGGQAWSLSAWGPAVEARTRVTATKPEPANIAAWKRGLARKAAEREAAERAR